MKMSITVILTSLVIVNCLASPQNGYYNRRQYIPQKYLYGHKGGYNSGPPIHKYRPPGYRSTRNPIIGSPYQPLPPGTNYPLPPQGVQQFQHAIPPSAYLHQAVHQQPSYTQDVSSLPVHPSVLSQGTQQIRPYQNQQIPAAYSSVPPKKYTPAPFSPQLFTKSPLPTTFPSITPWKNQPTNLNSIKQDNNLAQSFTAPITRTFYKPSDERSPIHTIPAPKLSPADRPVDFEYKVQQSTPSQYQLTPNFKLLNKAVINQAKMNPHAILWSQTKTQFAPDPDPRSPQVRVPPTNDPFSQPSNGKVPIDIYLQQQLDNEIAQQENLLIQKQKALENQKYQQQLEAQFLLQAQQQALQAQQQEQIKQQFYQQQALEVQRQLSLQAQQQAALQQPQYQSQQPAESLTEDELFNLMHGIAPNNQPRNQPYSSSAQQVLLIPQQQNEIPSSSTTNFQPNYQSFNYNEKVHQEEHKQDQQQQVASSDLNLYQSETQQQNFNPQYENFNYDEKTKRNGFGNEGTSLNNVGQQILAQVDEITQNANKNDIAENETRYQKHIAPATQTYSTLPKEITENYSDSPQYVHQQQHQTVSSTSPSNYIEKPVVKKGKPVYPGQYELKKLQHPHNLKKKNRVPVANAIPPNNGYSTIAEDLLQQHDLKNDLQHLTYSTLPNKRILEALKTYRKTNVTQHNYHQQNTQTTSAEKNNLQKIRENAQKFYNPHILQNVRKNHSNSDNVQIQQSIQIYETSYPSKSDDNHIDLSGITTTTAATESIATTQSTTIRSTSEQPNIVTEINVIENTGDSTHQESNLFEEIMLQDESKPLEDNYNSNSHSYFGQRIRPKRT